MCWYGMDTFFSAEYYYWPGFAIFAVCCLARCHEETFSEAQEKIRRKKTAHSIGGGALLKQPLFLYSGG